MRMATAQEQTAGGKSTEGMSEELDSMRRNEH